MAARSHLFTLLSIVAGAGCVVAVSTTGCGGKTDEQPAVVDSGDDTGIVIVETGPETAADAATDVEEPVPDSPSLFELGDAIPDTTFDGGVTAKGCYDCTTDQCKSEVEACDGDRKCRFLFGCLLTECGGQITDQSCLLGCAVTAGVTSQNDPAVRKIFPIFECNQGKCSDACPALPGGPDAGPDARPDATGDAAADAPADTADADSAASMSFSTPQIENTIDPALIEILRKVNGSFANPDLRRGMIDHLQSLPR
jgi:hypothetical protein